jgi:hypothetical protein
MERECLVLDFGAKPCGSRTGIEVAVSSTARRCGDVA